ncbi:hypothetical protein HZ326_24457 [Fusarium oxysporum f. sp. albedinis]|nr:hypothetical protein HZ326_24457 [Fusarium oxysporum f. sp. albedinis]
MMPSVEQQADKDEITQSRYKFPFTLFWITSHGLFSNRLSSNLSTAVLIKPMCSKHVRYPYISHMILVPST